MKPEELARLIEEAIQSADSTYTRQIIRVQNILYNDLLVILKDLELDPEGNILQSSTNRKVLDQADLKVYEVMQGPLIVKSMSDYVSTISRVDALNKKYFSEMPGFKDNKMFLKSLQRQAIETVEKNILQDGLQAQVINPLSQILNANVNSGGKFSGFLQQVQDFVKGNNQVEGRALSYSRTYLRNTLFQYARAYQKAVTADIGLEWYLYAGGLMDTSRDFCIERAGHYFHQREIESWASLQWKGKDPLTTESSIFILVAGYNCFHELIPVHISIVPVEDLERYENAQAVDSGV